MKLLERSVTVKQILIFAGTTEGRQLIERLCQYHIQIHACVATEY